ncbi:allantoate permease [Colletotrichum tofieldiae]|nr:allantoate permease [Colletotrichum tofieldiae]GKT69632.1 allantoate permease [Colletotrichum tofieldiae]GKT92548.1 allantoate permease [Colletotrichum tofieldiae]
MKQETSVQGNHEIAPAPSHIVLEHQEGDKMTNEYAGTQAIYVDEKTNRELFWVVNRRILACMLGTYFCQSLDKGTLGFASVMNIRQDANLVGQQFRQVISTSKKRNKHEQLLTPNQ